MPTRIVYTGTKLLSQPNNIKDPTPFEEQHNITLFVVLKSVMRITSVKVHDERSRP